MSKWRKKILSHNILKQVSIYLPGICACLDNHIGMVSDETTYTAGLCTNTVTREPKELCFQRQKLLSPIVIGSLKIPGSFGLAQQVFIQLDNWQMKIHPIFFSMLESGKLFKLKIVKKKKIFFHQHQNERHWQEKKLRKLCTSMVCISICAKLRVICSPF